jgi:hypothetical protein
MATQYFANDYNFSTFNNMKITLTWDTATTDVKFVQTAKKLASSDIQFQILASSVLDKSYIKNISTHDEICKIKDNSECTLRSNYDSEIKNSILCFYKRFVIMIYHAIVIQAVIIGKGTRENIEGKSVINIKKWLQSGINSFGSHLPPCFDIFTKMVLCYNKKGGYDNISGIDLHEKIQNVCSSNIYSNMRLEESVGEDILSSLVSLFSKSYDNIKIIESGNYNVDYMIYKTGLAYNYLGKLYSRFSESAVDYKVENLSEYLDSIKELIRNAEVIGGKMLDIVQIKDMLPISRLQEVLKLQDFTVDNMTQVLAFLDDNEYYFCYDKYLNVINRRISVKDLAEFNQNVLKFNLVSLNPSLQSRKVFSLVKVRNCAEYIKLVVFLCIVGYCEPVNLVLKRYVEKYAVNDVGNIIVGCLNGCSRGLVVKRVTGKRSGLNAVQNFISLYNSNINFARTVPVSSGIKFNRNYNRIMGVLGLNKVVTSPIVPIINDPLKNIPQVTEKTIAPTIGEIISDPLKNVPPVTEERIIQPKVFINRKVKLMDNSIINTEQNYPTISQIISNPLKEIPLATIVTPIINTEKKYPTINQINQEIPQPRVFKNRKPCTPNQS